MTAEPELIPHGAEHRKNFRQNERSTAMVSMELPHVLRPRITAVARRFSSHGIMVVILIGLVVRWTLLLMRWPSLSSKVQLEQVPSGPSASVPEGLTGLNDERPLVGGGGPVRGLAAGRGRNTIDGPLSGVEGDHIGDQGGESGEGGPRFLNGGHAPIGGGATA